MRQYREPQYLSKYLSPAKWLLPLLLAVALSACGFHLRGKADLPFKSIYLGMPANSSLAVELKRYLKASGVEVLPDAKGAEAIFQVIGESREKKILTLNTRGRVREYVLYLRISFLLKDAAGAILVPPTEIVLKRDISYNEEQELSKQAEEVILYQDMQSDEVQQILRRMTATQRRAPAATVEPVE